ncbi:MAG: twin-arginine translocation signal domain-containing protein, partial [Verrucomicrobiota bacterium]|nr:twin-arginine translocation signal domain-containing protein [Verrucomicrobiota bacterium]
MDLLANNRLALTRREFLGRGATGIGAAALASLLGQRLGQAADGGLPGFPQFAPKAKRVIYLTQSGAPSHTDLFDYKPGLQAWRGK